MKKQWTSVQTIGAFLGIVLMLFAWCNLLGPVAGMGGADYYQVASGGFHLMSANNCQTYFPSIPPEDSYRGTMNWILRPLSSAFPGLDVRVLSTVYFLAVVLVFAWFLKKLKPEKNWYLFLIAGVAGFIFCDFAYLLHLNSLNPQGAFYGIILVMVSLLLLQMHHKTGLLKTVIYLFLCFMISGLKTGYWWIGVLFAVLLLPTFYLRKDALYRGVTLGLTVVTCIGCVVCYGDGVYYQKDQQNLFHSAYYGVLKENPDPQAISKLGLPEAAKEYSGKTIYDVSESVVDDRTLQTSYGKIMGYYLTHPKQFLDKLECSADNGYEIRQQYVSNYPDGDRLKYGFNLYSAIKRRFMQPDLWFVLVFLGAVAIYCALQVKKAIEASKKAHYLFLVLLCVVTLVTFVAPVIISGQAALDAELFLYNLLFDIVLCHVIVGGTITLTKRRENIQKKYGVQQ